MAGVAFGVISGRRATEALRYVRTRLWTGFGPKTIDAADDPYMSQFISPFMTSLELRARMLTGDTNGALELIRRLYARMARSGPKTAWESTALDGRPASGATSLAHPWSTGAVSALSEYVLGIRPAAPGYARWLIQPQVGNLRFSQGRLPTPHGALVSRWSRGPRNRWLRLTAGGARGTIGTVAVPELGAARTIAMDGRVVRRNRRRAPGVSAHRRGDTVFFDHITGTHTFAWRSGHAPPIVD